MDRIRASNTYGEPIVNFNEDSATKAEMKELIGAEVVNVYKRLKEIKRAANEQEPVVEDMRADIVMIKNIFKK